MKHVLAIDGSEELDNKLHLLAFDDSDTSEVWTDNAKKVLSAINVKPPDADDYGTAQAAVVREAKARYDAIVAGVSAWLMHADTGDVLTIGCDGSDDADYVLAVIAGGEIGFTIDRLALKTTVTPEYTRMTGVKDAKPKKSKKK